MRLLFKPQILRQTINFGRTHSIRTFSSIDIKKPLSDWDKEVVKELHTKIDMSELQKFNPKLYDKLKEEPEVILDLKDVIMANEAKS